MSNPWLSPGTLAIGSRRGLRVCVLRFTWAACVLFSSPPCPSRRTLLTCAGSTAYQQLQSYRRHRGKAAASRRQCFRGRLVRGVLYSSPLPLPLLSTSTSPSSRLLESYSSTIPPPIPHPHPRPPPPSADKIYRDV